MMCVERKCNYSRLTHAGNHMTVLVQKAHVCPHLLAGRLATLLRAKSKPRPPPGESSWWAYIAGCVHVQQLARTEAPHRLQKQYHAESPGSLS